jgi:hypothetical protein
MYLIQAEIKPHKPNKPQTAKHQTRFRRASLLSGDYRLSVDCLTKAVLSCQGPPDTSQSRLFPLVSHHAGGVGNAPVVIRLGGDFGDMVKTVMDAPIAKQTTKPPPKQTYLD